MPFLSSFFDVLYASVSSISISMRSIYIKIHPYFIPSCNFFLALFASTFLAAIYFAHEYGFLLFSLFTVCCFCRQSSLHPYISQLIHLSIGPSTMAPIWPLFDFVHWTNWFWTRCKYDVLESYPSILPTDHLWCEMVRYCRDVYERLAPPPNDGRSISPIYWANF